MNNFNIWDFLKKIGEARDFVLVFIGAVYFLGYLVWALISWRENLGSLNVLDVQYFVAGMPAMILLVLLFPIIILSRILVFDILPKRWNPHLTNTRNVLLVILPICLIVLFVLMVYYHRNETNRGFYSLILDISVIFIGYGVILILLSGSYVAAKSKTVTLDFKLLSIASLYILPFMITVLLISNFTLYLYPLIPQSLGGSKPRCAQLDIFKDNYSSETLHLLGLNKIKTEGEEVESTQKIDVLFLGSSYILVGIYSDPYMRLELDREGIEAIRWCGR